MHFVSEMAGKKLVRHQTDVFSQATGEKIRTLPTIWLTLERGGAPDWAVAEAVKRFHFAQRPTSGSIGGADIPVEQWCVYVDTEAWASIHGHDDAIREAAESVLLGSTDMLHVVPPKVVPPWPNYDELTVAGSRTAEKVAARNLETAEMVGVTIDVLIGYEEITLAREPVLAVYREALEALEAESGAPRAFAVEA